MRARRSDAGLSLIEATMILMVLSVLTAAIAPAAGSYIDGARGVKAKKDVESIGAAIDLVLRHTGVRCLSKVPALATINTLSCSLTNRVELLVSGPSITTNKPVVGPAAYVASTAIASNAALNWSGGTGEVLDAWKDTMDAHFVTNTANYPALRFTVGGGPRAGLGWRGAYLNGPMDVDPWGYSYQANTVFLTVASNATDATGTGEKRGGWASNVMVLSAGANGTIQTPFSAPTTPPAVAGAAAVGDDIAYVLQGATN